MSAENTRTTKDYPFKNSPAVVFLSERIDKVLADDSNMTQREIAMESGYNKPNIFSMFKNGETKIPIDRIPAMAKALRCDIRQFGRLVILQHFPNLGTHFEAIFGSMVSAEENKVLELWRNANNNVPMSLDKEASSDIANAFSEITKRMHERNRGEQERKRIERANQAGVNPGVKSPGKRVTSAA